MRIRTLMIAAAGMAALTVSACNRPAEEADAGMDAAGAEAAADAGADAAATTGGSGSGSGGSGSGAAASGGSGGAMTTTPPASDGSAGSVASVNSDIPANAPSRNTRETAAAAGAPNQGQAVPYAYAPTDPARQAR